VYFSDEQSSDRNEDFWRLKEDDANEQHKSIIEALEAAAPECDMRGVSVTDDGPLNSASKTRPMSCFYFRCLFTEHCSHYLGRS